MNSKPRIIAFLFYFALSISHLVSASQLPLATSISVADDDYILNLPYARYLGFLDEDHDIVIFKNIRFAASPENENRWKKPQPPVPTDELQDGYEGGTCYQAYPGWMGHVGRKPNDRFPVPKKPLDEYETEDCLFLDVYVPRTAINNTNIDPLPVLFWVYGGGFDAYTGTPLVTASNNSIIYVQANYRLGAFGFLASDYLTGGSAVANAGFWDQRAALDWTAKYIKLLGGNPSQITVMGESAGASSILHHLVSTEPPVFKRVILSSPGFVPQYDQTLLQEQFTKFASVAECRGDDLLKCLREKDGEVLQEANRITVHPADYGTFVYGPAVDKALVPDLPGILLKAGKFHKNIDIIVGHNSNEGALFVDPDVQTPADFRTWVTQAFPSAPTPQFLDEVLRYYPDPPVPPRYEEDSERLDQLVSEAVINCNTLFTSDAYGRSKTWNYEFAVFLGLHGMDLCWTFYPDYTLMLGGLDICKILGSNPSQPKSFQSYLASFVLTGNPNSKRDTGTIEWRNFGGAGDALTMDGSEFKMARDTKVPTDRCGFWQSAPYCTTCGT